MELGYHDFGKATESAPGASAEFKASAFELLAVGILPVTNEFSLYGKAGLYRGEVKATASVTGLGSGSITETNIDLTFGVGAQYNFTRQFGVRAEWQRYMSMGDNATIGEADVDTMSLGVIYRFQ
jgi:OOP family OmpA-OmpF porin